MTQVLQRPGYPAGLLHKWYGAGVQGGSVAGQHRLRPAHGGGRQTGGRQRSGSARVAG